MHEGRCTPHIYPHQRKTVGTSSVALTTDAGRGGNQGLTLQLVISFKNIFMTILEIQKHI